jgi:hypothetical protein
VMPARAGKMATASRPPNRDRSLLTAEADHQDPVTTSHLADGEPGSVATLARPLADVPFDSREIP